LQVPNKSLYALMSIWLASDDTTSVLGRFMYLLCHIMSSKNQNRQEWWKRGERS